jgi:hypothetical protein
MCGNELRSDVACHDDEIMLVVIVETPFVTPILSSVSDARPLHVQPYGRAGVTKPLRREDACPSPTIVSDPPAFIIGGWYVRRSLLWYFGVPILRVGETNETLSLKN